MLKNFSEIIFPPRCVFCQRPGYAGLDICQSCYHALPFIKSACVQCALPLEADSGEEALCGHCLNSPPLFNRSQSLMRYENRAVQLITRYKFHERLAYSRLLAELLIKQLAHVDRPDCLIAVPLYDKRLYERGFNQSHEIAKIIAKKLKLPLASELVLRVRDTGQQAGLNARQRRRNIRGAFAVTKPVVHKHVALIDDVVTTGSTVNELARVLKRAGVETVQVWSLARAI